MSLKVNSEYQSVFKALAKKYPTPEAVQKFLRSFSYNDEPDGPSLKSALRSVKEKSIHCIEGAFIAAAILEQHGYPPMILSLESCDQIDHIVYLYRENGCWGSIGYSKFEGLYGRKPVYRSIRDLVWSYFDVYIDATGKIVAYQKLNLDESKMNWRSSQRFVWRIERFLIDYPHIKLPSSKKRYLTQKEKFLNKTQKTTDPMWW